LRWLGFLVSVDTFPATPAKSPANGFTHIFHGIAAVIVKAGNKNPAIADGEN